MHRFRLIPLFLLSLCLLTSCKGTAKVQSALSAPQEEITSLRMQLDYYESRLTLLEKELLDAKAALYEKEVSAPVEKAREPDAPAAVSPSPLWFHEIKESYAVVTGVSGAPEEIVIPSSLGGVAVKKIGERAFSDLDLRSAVIPDGVTEIGWFAFCGCVNLEEIFLPASVEKIEYGAFENCPSSLVFICPEGSYAAHYARSYGFAVRAN